MTHLPELTIQKADQARPQNCARCGGTVPAAAVAAEWNGQRFTYCPNCEKPVSEKA